MIAAVMKVKLIIFSGILLFGLLSAANAHFLWVTIDGENEQRTANILFEHALRIEDGKYIPHFIRRGKTWIHDSMGVRELAVKDTKREGLRWLSAKLDNPGPVQIASCGLFGVYRYGKKDVLLHYYAKHLDLESAADLERLARSKNLDLDIIPSQTEDGTVTLKVLWKGKPVAGRNLTVRGPSRFDLKTDAEGEVRFKPEKKGLHSVLTSVEENTPGTDEVENKDYIMIRHQSTLVMNLPVKP